MKSIAILIAAMFLAGATAHAASDKADATLKVAAEKAVIEALLERVVQLESNGDAETYATLFTSDAILLPPGQPSVAGADAIREYWQAAFKEVSLANITATAEEIEVFGDRAYLRVTYDHIATNKRDGTSVKEEGKSLWILRRLGDGTWKYSHAIWNADM